MNVFGVDDQHYDNHALRFLRPLLDHQEAIDKGWNGNSNKTCSIDEQLAYAPITAIRDCAIDKVYGLNEGAFAAGTKLADAIYYFKMLRQAQFSDPSNAA